MTLTGFTYDNLNFTSPLVGEVARRTGEGVAEASMAELSMAEFKSHHLFLFSATLQHCNTDETPHSTLRVDLSHKGRGKGSYTSLYIDQISQIFMRRS